MNIIFIFSPGSPTLADFYRPTLPLARSLGHRPLHVYIFTMEQTLQYTHHYIALVWFPHFASRIVIFITRSDCANHSSTMRLLLLFSFPFARSLRLSRVVVSSGALTFRLTALVAYKLLGVYSVVARIARASLSGTVYGGILENERE